MEDRIKQKKAFLGAIMAGVNMIGGIAGGIAKRKAQKRMMRKQLAEQTRQEGLQQAQAMTSGYADQDYVDEYNNKIVFKNGGSTKHYTDRIKHTKKYKCGGRRKANFGTQLAGAFKGDKLGSSLTTIMNTTGGIANNAISSGQQQLLAPKHEFKIGEVKTNLETPSYQVDTNGNPVTALNSEQQIDRLQIAKMGTKRKRKSYL